MRDGCAKPKPTAGVHALAQQGVKTLALLRERRVIQAVAWAHSAASCWCSVLCQSTGCCRRAFR